MVKVESNMLILDSTFSKQDAAAINEFIDIAKKEEQNRIIELINQTSIMLIPQNLQDVPAAWERIWKPNLIAMIKGEQE